MSLFVRKGSKEYKEAPAVESPRAEGEVAVVEDENLPLPYARYNDPEVRNIFFSCNEYRKILQEWTTKNTIDRPIENSISMAMGLAKPTPLNGWIRNWLNQHKDKVRYMTDFSGLVFGLYVNERTEEFCIKSIIGKSVETLSMYDEFDKDQYENFSIFDELNWIYDHCEFIPLKVVSEDLYDGSSHKWGHFKRDEYFLNQLKYYLQFICDEVHQPSDDVYYYTRYSRSGYTYLERDIISSPRRNYDGR